jgi:hypothetical protein
VSSTTVALPSVPGSYWPKVGWAFLLLGAVLAAAHALLFATVPDYHLGAIGSQQKARMFIHAAVGYSHTVGGAIASLIGPFQFVGSFRRRYPRWHVWCGRVYLVCVGLSALAGLYLSPNSEARDTLGIGFIMLALAWLYTGTKAYLAIRARDVEAHRRWMIRNYALTYAAVALRLHMPLLIAGGLAPVTALNVEGWLCWVPNLILVELWIRLRARGAIRGVPA